MSKSNLEEQALLMDQDIGKPWIEIFHIIEDLSTRSFLYHSKWHQPNSWVMLCSLSPIKNNRWVMLCSYSPINDSYDCLNNTVYLAFMLQATCHTAEGS